MLKIFKKARIKLTLFYLTILTVVIFFFSMIVYFQTMRNSNFILGMQKDRIERQIQRFGYPRDQLRNQLNLLGQEEIEEIRRRTIQNLFFVNLVILGISGVLSYFLAGRTLRPIEQILAKQRFFVSNAAHELKTPLTAIKTNLEVTLRDKKLSLEDAKTAMDETIQDVDKLNGLAVMLLNQETASNDKNFSTVDLLELLQNVVKEMTSLAHSQNQKIIFEGIPANVTGNTDELAQVFTNLIDNAIKYSKRDGIVEVRLYVEGKTAIVKVSDQGMGIAKDDLPYIFDPFYRADKSRSNSNSFGLGLSIANEIVKKHEGKIEANSAINTGSTFTVCLKILNA